MALDSSKVAAGITGAVAVDALNTATAPTGTASALTGFVEVGYIGPDGITEARDRTSDPKTAWQGGDVVRVLNSEGVLTYNFVMLETNKTVIETYYGTSVSQTSTEGTYVIDANQTGGRKRWVITAIDGADIERTYAPQAEVTAVGDKVIVNNEVIGYEVTLTCYRDSALGGQAKVWNTRLKS